MTAFVEPRNRGAARCPLCRSAVKITRTTIEEGEALNADTRLFHTFTWHDTRQPLRIYRYTCWNAACAAIPANTLDEFLAQSPATFDDLWGDDQPRMRLVKTGEWL